VRARWGGGVPLPPSPHRYPAAHSIPRLNWLADRLGRDDMHLLEASKHPLHLLRDAAAEHNGPFSDQECR
jgi:hypothetical protein